MDYLKLLSNPEWLGKAREAANGWVDRGDLTAILQLLDIPETEWVQ